MSTVRGPHHLRWFAGSVCKQASGGAGVMRWCVASFADGDTHLAEPGPPGQTVTAHCDGRQFCPTAILTGAPPDQEQVCPPAEWAAELGDPRPAGHSRWLA